MIIELHSQIDGSLVLVETTSILVTGMGSGSRVFVAGDNYIDVSETVEEIKAKTEA